MVKEDFSYLMSNEYLALRDGLKLNRKFVFERPLLIVGGAFAANAIFKSQEYFTDILGITVIIILYFNLWFTMNRLKSSARIISYIRLFHEGKFKELWFGCENSLVEYRKWCLNNVEKFKKIKSDYSKKKQYDSGRFCGPIFSFHLVMILIIMFTVILSKCQDSITNHLIEMYCSFSLYILILILSFKFWIPKIIRNSILAETEIWEEIMENLKVIKTK